MLYDAIVVGARCAGSPTAMLLSRKGYRVLLVERASFPSDVVSTLIIKYPGVQLLKQWGLLGAVMATNCPPVRQWLDHKGDFLLSAPLPAVDHVVTVAPRRIVLDRILAAAAVQSGADLLENCVVEEILSRDGRVTGIRGRTRGGGSVTAHGRIVIGADGKHSLLARTVKPETYHCHPVRACYYYAFWSGIPDMGLVSYWRNQHFVLAIPTNDRLTCLVIARPAAEFDSVRKNVEAAYWRCLEISPLLHEYARQGRREGRFIGTVDLPNVYRKPFGPGWALAGDAGHHEDPLMGHGIMNAFHDAALLAEAIDAGFSGRMDLDVSLADYEIQRNQWSLPAYRRNVAAALLEGWDSEQELRLRSALRDNPHEAGRYFGVRVYAVPFEQFFSAENIARIAGNGLTF